MTNVPIHHWILVRMREDALTLMAATVVNVIVRWSMVKCNQRNRRRRPQPQPQRLIHVKLVWLMVFYVKMVNDGHIIPINVQYVNVWMVWHDVNIDNVIVHQQIILIHIVVHNVYALRFASIKRIVHVCSEVVNNGHMIVKHVNVL